MNKKEISIEEKARRYDEAIAHAKILLKTIGNATLGNLVLKNEFENMFPELKESEDEIIRKDLISHFNETIENIRGEEIIPHESKVLIGKMQKWIDWLEKQGEQKPAWSEEDERIYKVVLELIDSYSKGTIGGCIIPPNVERYAKWFKALKDRCLPQPKQEWSGEDDEIIEEIINDIECARAINYHAPKEGYEFRENWLKSLKDRVQPKQGWGEEDNINCKRLLYLLNGGNLMHDHKVELFIWVESIKDRYTWKPSDEQMDAILTVIGDERQKGSDVTKELLKVYHHLKKLKE